MCAASAGHAPNAFEGRDLTLYACQTRSQSREMTWVRLHCKLGPVLTLVSSLLGPHYDNAPVVGADSICGLLSLRPDRALPI